jgi:hypothetical protein
MNKLLVMLLSGLAFGAGCSSSPQGDASGGHPTTSTPTTELTPLEQAAQKRGEANCRSVFQCCDAEAQKALGYGATDVSGCIAQADRAVEYEAFVTQWQGAIDAGRIKFDGSAAAACFAAKEARPCAQAFSKTEPDECKKAFAPQVETGGDCVLDIECKEAGNFCLGLKCNVPLADGAVCNNSYECQSGYCAAVNAEPGKCAQKFADGADCVLDNQCKGGLCYAHQTCSGSQIDPAKECDGTNVGK